jgi:DNA-binding transcriptional ArsR family regulator
MPKETRQVLAEPAALKALTHPVRLDVLRHLMATGPATASECARAVGDNPSNCSYHLRVLAEQGWVEEDQSADGRERPWRAIVTGLTTDRAVLDGKTGAAAMATSLQLDQRQARDYLVQRRHVEPRWRKVDSFNSYGLLVTPAELEDLVARLDALIRPYIAATREDAPKRAGQVQLALQAFPLSKTP